MHITTRLSIILALAGTQLVHYSGSRLHVGAAAAHADEGGDGGGEGGGGDGGEGNGNDSGDDGQGEGDPGDNDPDADPDVSISVDPDPACAGFVTVSVFDSLFGGLVGYFSYDPDRGIVAVTAVTDDPFGLADLDHAVASYGRR